MGKPSFPFAVDTLSLSEDLDGFPKAPWLKLIRMLSFTHLGRLGFLQSSRFRVESNESPTATNGSFLMSAVATLRSFCNIASSVQIIVDQPVCRPRKHMPMWAGGWCPSSFMTSGATTCGLE